jgi:hypothetical protein
MNKNNLLIFNGGFMFSISFFALYVIYMICLLITSVISFKTSGPVGSGKDIEWYHFWNAYSGPGGGLIFLIVYNIIFSAVIYLLKIFGLIKLLT